MPPLEMRTGPGTLLLGVVPSALVAPRPWATILVARKTARGSDDTEPGHRLPTVESSTPRGSGEASISRIGVYLRKFRGQVARSTVEHHSTSKWIDAIDTTSLHRCHCLARPRLRFQMAFQSAVCFIRRKPLALLFYHQEPIESLKFHSHHFITAAASHQTL